MSTTVDMRWCVIRKNNIDVRVPADEMMVSENSQAVHTSPGVVQ